MKPRILVLMILFCILPLVSCESKLEKSQKQQQEEEDSEARHAQLQESKYRTSAVLLSLKFDMPESDVFKLLIEYDDDYFKYKKDKKRKVKLGVAAFYLSINQITELATEFHTTPKTIAAMLIDFESMRKCECPES